MRSRTLFLFAVLCAFAVGCAEKTRVEDSPAAVIANIEGRTLDVAGEYGTPTVTVPLDEVRMVFRVFNEEDPSVVMGYPENKGFEICRKVRNPKFPEDYPRTKEDAKRRCIWEPVEQFDSLIPGGRVSRWMQAPPRSVPYHFEYLWSDGVFTYVCDFYRDIDFETNDAEHGGWIMDAKIVFHKGSLQNKCPTVTDETGKKTSLWRYLQQHDRDR